MKRAKKRTETHCSSGENCFCFSPIWNGLFCYFLVCDASKKKLFDFSNLNICFFSFLFRILCNFLVFSFTLTDFNNHHTFSEFFFSIVLFIFVFKSNVIIETFVFSFLFLFRFVDCFL